MLEDKGPSLLHSCLFKVRSRRQLVLQTKIFLSRNRYPQILLENELIGPMLNVDVGHTIFDKHLFGHPLLSRGFLIGDPDIGLPTADKISLVNGAAVSFISELF